MSTFLLSVYQDGDRSIKSTIVTEQSLSFTNSDNVAPFFTVHLNRSSQIFLCINRYKFFSANLIPSHEVDYVKGLYNLSSFFDETRWQKTREVPIYRKSIMQLNCINPIFLDIDANDSRVLVKSEIRSCTRRDLYSSPLINYNDGYYSLGEKISSVKDEAVKNPRILDD